ncbi:hypothetical protein XV92_15330 [Vibrio metoecus]|uniref:Uncharacterized protein n=1 Tax=Vibrio metoecus TaxID=1481663 RepID=A0A0Q0PVW1_VIBMT|nr:hypothetical protein XV92_15330 [Vibrio metoecus]
MFPLDFSVKVPNDRVARRVINSCVWPKYSAWVELDELPQINAIFRTIHTQKNGFSHSADKVTNHEQIKHSVL